MQETYTERIFASGEEFLSEFLSRRIQCHIGADNLTVKQIQILRRDLSLFLLNMESHNVRLDIATKVDLSE